MDAQERRIALGWARDPSVAQVTYRFGLHGIDGCMFAVCYAIISMARGGNTR